MNVLRLCDRAIRRLVGGLDPSIGCGRVLCPACGVGFSTAVMLLRLISH